MHRQAATAGVPGVFRRVSFRPFHWIMSSRLLHWCGRSVLRPDVTLGDRGGPSREFGSRDGFARDCPLRHFRTKPRTSAGADFTPEAPRVLSSSLFDPMMRTSRSAIFWGLGVRHSRSTSLTWLMGFRPLIAAPAHTLPAHATPRIGVPHHPGIGHHDRGAQALDFAAPKKRLRKQWIIGRMMICTWQRGDI